MAVGGRVLVETAQDGQFPVLQHRLEEQYLVMAIRPLGRDVGARMIHGNFILLMRSLLVS